MECNGKGYLYKEYEVQVGGEGERRRSLRDRKGFLHTLSVFPEHLLNLSLRRSSEKEIHDLSMRVYATN